VKQLVRVGNRSILPLNRASERKMDRNIYGSVLVVEDHSRERESLLALLRKAGHDAWGVGDAASALMALDLATDAVDVVLCDLRMNSSSSSGVELLREWKSRRPSTPFIFVTGVYDISQVVEAVKLGAEDYITKPYKVADLLRRVEECIASHGSFGSSRLTASFSESIACDLKLPPNLSLEQLERIAIEGALQRTAGNRTHAANALGISVRTLQRKLRAWTADEVTQVERLTGGLR
jgi:DNA-binding NtrC family response regulator